VLGWISFTRQGKKTDGSEVGEVSGVVVSVRELERRLVDKVVVDKDRSDADRVAALSGLAASSIGVVDKRRRKLVHEMGFHIGATWRMSQWR
jgi:predicted mannosyl-3-phosphoglycerate phosphatase (HAD superfamily)